MAKTIIREIIILLLLCLAIILILGVLLYGYVPNNKIMPEQVSYITPENIKEELNKNDGLNENDVILTYEVDSSDLNDYQKIQDYKPGKTNPFSTYKVETENATNEVGGNTTGSGTNSISGGSTSAGGATGSSSSSTSSSSGSSKSGSSSSTGHFFQDKGVK